MHKTIRKTFISILSIIIVFITMIATTYAWVGMLSYSSVGEFNINVKTENQNTDYSLFISPTGEYNLNGDIVNNSFKEQLTNSDLTQIKKQILINKGSYDDAYLSTDESINSAFNRLGLFSASPNIKDNKVDLTSFITYNSDINKYEFAKNYYKFDIYLSVDSSNGEITSSTNYLVDLYIKNIQNSLMGNTITGSTIDSFEYNDNYLNGIILPPGFSKLDSITNNTIITTNSSYSTRLALEYYEGIPITDTYSGEEVPLGQYVYQNGTQIPMYDNNTNLYSFGGVVKEEDNIALSEYEYIKGINLVNSYNYYAKQNNLVNFDKLVEVRKNDLLLEEANSNICSNLDSLKLGIINGQRYKVKITLYFWYEGWDADNFMIINQTSTNINLVLSSNFNDY